MSIDLRFQNKTRYIDHTFQDAPQIELGYGSYINILNKVLVEGINFRVLSNLELLEEGKVKATFVDAPYYPVETVIKIEGFGDDRIDGCHRVMETEGSSVYFYIKEFETPVVNPTEIGLVSVCTAPLGFTRVYSNASNDIMCFKTATQSVPGILKVIDKIPTNGYSTSWAYYARVVVGESIDSEGNFINNIKAPYHPVTPDVELTGNGVSGSGGVHGFAKWKYRITDHYYGYEHSGTLYDKSRPWSIIGDGDTFYMIFNPGPDTSLHGFGHIDSAAEHCLALQAVDGYYSTNMNGDYNSYGKAFNPWGNVMKSSAGSFLLHSAHGAVTNRTLRYFSGGKYFGEVEKSTPWKSNEIPVYNPTTGLGLNFKLTIVDTDGFFRGAHRGFVVPYGDNSIATGRVVGTPDRVLRMTDPYRVGGSMPLIFTMEDWKSVE